MSKILFLDESGDHNLTFIDPLHPIFVLGGFVTTKEYAFGELSQKLDAFKIELFGTTNIILHTADFSRQRNGFEQMKDATFCEKFYQKLNQLIAELDITILACAIKKEPHVIQHALNTINPYHLSLSILAERFCFYIKKHEYNGQIIIEARDALLNTQLEGAWLNVKAFGTYYMHASGINRRIDELILKTKQDKIAGLEIADVIVTPIARRLLGRSSRVDIGVIENKMRKNSLGEVIGYGLMILP